VKYQISVELFLEHDTIYAYKRIYEAVRVFGHYIRHVPSLLTKLFQVLFWGLLYLRLPE
jgi:hypothetical protein